MSRKYYNINQIKFVNCYVLTFKKGTFRIEVGEFMHFNKIKIAEEDIYNAEGKVVIKNISANFSKVFLYTDCWLQKLAFRNKMSVISYFLDPDFTLVYYPRSTYTTLPNTVRECSAYIISDVKFENIENGKKILLKSRQILISKKVPKIILIKIIKPKVDADIQIGFPIDL